MQGIVIRPDTVLEEDHIVVAQFRIARARLHTSMGGHADEDDGLYTACSQYTIEIGLIKATRSPLVDDSLCFQRLELVDDLPAPGAFHGEQLIFFIAALDERPSKC